MSPVVSRAPVGLAHEVGFAPFSVIGESREQTVDMGEAGSAVSGILGFVLRDSLGPPG